MKGIRRTLGTAQTGKSPVKAEHLRTIISGLDADRALDVRDRALLLIGFAGAFRRSELVGLGIEDLEFNENGLVVYLRRSKTDPEGQGRKVGIRTVPLPRRARCGPSKLGWRSSRPTKDHFSAPWTGTDGFTPPA